MIDHDLLYPSEETKIARLPRIVRRARALQRRERRQGEQVALDHEPVGIDRAGDWIEQASESAACDIVPAQEL